MCYSAQIEASYKKYVRLWGADISIKDFVQLYWLRSENPKIKIPKAMGAAFSEPQNDDEREIKRLIDTFNTERAAKLEQELFKQRKRLADAERTLLTKTTKRVVQDKRIATEKVTWCLGKAKRSAPLEFDRRGLPNLPAWYAPVMVMENGRHVVKPMRYQCRIAGPAFIRCRHR